MSEHTEGRPFADQRAEEGTPVDEADQADFADEHAPSPADPPNAEADAPGGEAEGYQPQTEVPD